MGLGTIHLLCFAGSTCFVSQATRAFTTLTTPYLSIWTLVAHTLSVILIGIDFLRFDPLLGYLSRS